MLSSKLIQLIEDHAEQIGARVMRNFRNDPRLHHHKGLPELEVRQKAQELLKNLGHWLVASKEEEVSAYYQHVGRLRCHEMIPLAEVVLAYLIVKEEMLQFVRDMGIGQTPVELYAEEELEHDAGQFFDHVIYELVRGYETVLREPAAAAVRAV